MQIEIKGLAELITRLNAVSSAGVLYGAMKAAAEHIKGKIAKYPPASEANVPMQRRWYQRGYGTKWMTKEGNVHGKKTSETLGRRWTTAVRADGQEARVGNNASYAPYVQSREKQAKFHAYRGWKTAEDVTEEELKTVKRIFEDRIRRALK